MMFSYCSMTKYTNIILYFNDLMTYCFQITTARVITTVHTRNAWTGKKYTFYVQKRNIFFADIIFCPLLHLNVLEQVNVQCHKH